MNGYLKTCMILTDKNCLFFAEVIKTIDHQIMHWGYEANQVQNVQTSDKLIKSYFNICIYSSRKTFRLGLLLAIVRHI